MRIGVVACEIFKEEIDQMVAGDEDISHLEYLELALHNEPERLREEVVSKANSLKGRVDGVLLGYCYCQSLEGVLEHIELPAEMVHTDDCIGVFLTPERYEEERSICPGTWFNSPGWAKSGVDGAIKELKLDLVADKMDPKELLLMMFDGYSRCLFIDTGAGDVPNLLGLSHKFADEMRLRHEETVGGYSMLKEALTKLKSRLA